MLSRRAGRRRKLATLTAVLATSSVFSPGAAIWPFPPKRFTGTSLIGAGSLGLNGDGRIVAFGDFNGDQLLDVLVLGSDQQTLSVYYWQHESFTFSQAHSFKHPTKVYNVVPGDFTHSGKLDLLVMSQSDESGEQDLRLYPSLVGDGFDTENPLNLPPSTLSQPIPLDIDGDMKIDLLGITPDSSHSSTSPYQVWQNVWNASSSNPKLFNLEDAPFKGRQCAIANPHSNAVIDLDGDCLADVFLLCDEGHGRKSFQIWINNKDDGFVLSQQGSLPPDTQAISFADIDRDGTIDLIFPTCYRVSASGVGTNCHINIAYNQQLPLCASSTDSGIKKGIRVCRRPEDLCISDPNFKFNLTDSPDNDAFVRFPLESLFPQTPALLVRDSTFSPFLPTPIRLGDANLDGFPDLLLITVSGKTQTPSLVFSVPCDKDVAGCPKGTSDRRGWSVATKGTKVLEDVKDARALTFLDLDEDGTLDIMVQRSGADGQGNVLFVQNNFYYDAFFLKAIVLNGACNNGWCYNANGSERYHPFGVSYSGATYKYTVLDTAGHRSAAQVGQLPQTSYQSLQTPYSFFGLGRTNNYIENLFVGTTIHAEQHYINMEGVIPNSKVVILPSADEGGEWKRELFLRPGEWIPWVTVTVMATMILLAIIVLVLHLNEKREDEQERRRASHHINFDAL
ncbi:hypothetical protein BDN70DRAFT_824769 [Pholiota conissans]|uniref:T-cell immunomodulatory protein TIP C2 domain-containing protein n=1 Tax=Pholiota conissans TaxID=109636 RepID=A0A9P5ZC31_9AGAR|nr:hypothetical protein BDN70DRAFT_824769 [Pholiota conissans]